MLYNHACTWKRKIDLGQVNEQRKHFILGWVWVTESCDLGMWPQVLVFTIKRQDYEQRVYNSINCIKIKKRWLASLDEQDFKNKTQDDDDLFLDNYKLLSAKHEGKLATIDLACLHFVNQRIVALGSWWTCGESDRWKMFS